jgi:ABC-type spermidine/putrescine transport system permease subunit I
VLAVSLSADRGWSIQHDGFSWWVAGPLAACLPTILLAFPAVYLLGGLVNGAVSEDHPWPLGLAFALLLGACAVANVWLAATLSHRRASRQRVPDA